MGDNLKVCLGCKDGMQRQKKMVQDALMMKALGIVTSGGKDLINV